MMPIVLAIMSTILMRLMEFMFREYLDKLS